MNFQEKKIFKIAIIGAGAAGLYIADKLENKSDLIIIESGDKNKYKKDYINHKFQMSKESTHILNTDQVSGLGGNTNLWGGQLLPFTSDDINKENGWPFGIDELSQNYSNICKNLLGQNINYFSKNFIERFINRKFIYENDENFNIHISSWIREPNFKKIFGYLKRKILILDNFFVNNIKYINDEYYELKCSNSFLTKNSCKKVVIACGGFNQLDY